MTHPTSPSPPVEAAETSGDIVTRLRTAAEEDLRAIAQDMPTMGLTVEPAELREWADLMDAAADENERLRAALRPFAEAHRKHESLRRMLLNPETIISMIGNITAQDLARAAELVPEETT